MSKLSFQILTTALVAHVESMVCVSTYGIVSHAAVSRDSLERPAMVEICQFFVYRYLNGALANRRTSSTAPR